MIAHSLPVGYDKNGELFYAFRVCLELKNFRSASRLAEQIHDPDILFKMLLLTKSQEKKENLSNADITSIQNLTTTINEKIPKEISEYKNSRDIRLKFLNDPNMSLQECTEACEEIYLDPFKILLCLYDLSVLKPEMQEFPLNYALKLQDKRLKIDALFEIVDRLLESEKISPNDAHCLNRCLEEVLPAIQVDQRARTCERTYKLFNCLFRANRILKGKEKYVELGRVIN